MQPTPRQILLARLSLILAAVLWSSGSFFTRVLTAPTLLHLDEPRLTPVQIAFWRGLFAGLALVPLLRRVDLRFRPIMPAMVICFTVMCGLYLSAMGLGKAANAILLQNTAPVWVYLFGVYILGQARDRLALQSTVLGMIGAAVIVIGNWPRGLPAEQEAIQVEILLMATGSGITYAGVVLFLNYLKTESSAWLMVLNLLGSATCIGSFVYLRFGATVFTEWFLAPTWQQLLFLALFGAVQMATPYFLFARGLKSVSAMEAGIITLLEPVLNPIWAYLVAPEQETLTVWTWIGGSLLMAALIWRYIPRKSQRKDPQV